MKKVIQTIFLVVVLFACLKVNGQEEQPVQWDCSVKKISANKYEVRMKAYIDPGWHLYSQEQPAEAQIFPTRLVINNNPLIVKKGKVAEQGNKVLHKDPVPGSSHYYYYTGKMELVQVVEVKKGVRTNLTGEVEFQACTNMSCLTPSKESFSLSLR